MKKKEDYIINFDSKKLISFHFKLALKPQKREKKNMKKTLVKCCENAYIKLENRKKLET